MLAATIIAATVAAAAPPEVDGASPPPDRALPQALPSDTPDRVALRTDLGIGLIALRAGAAGTWWVNRGLGFGLEGVVLAGLLRGKSVGAVGGGPAVSLRSSATGSYGLFSAFVGAARRSRSELCWYSDECSPNTEVGVSPLLGTAVGWMFSVDIDKGVHLGPLLRVDAAGDSVAVTLDFALGVPILR
jgi:hypothetical protein